MTNIHLIKHPLIKNSLSKLRDKTTNHIIFRKHLHIISQLMTFEITRKLSLKKQKIQTPLAQAEGFLLAKEVTLVPILRAGLGMLHGILRILSEASIGHIGMYRDENTLVPKSYYCNLPKNIENSYVFLIDPMLATGKSSSQAAKKLKENGANKLFFINLISCKPGIEEFQKSHPEIPIFTAAIDPILTEKGYISPGLGDAGDRYFHTF